MIDRFKISLYRLLNCQFSLQDLSFEEVKRHFVSNASSIWNFGDVQAKNSVLIEERLKALVYSIYVDNLLIMYRPYSGYKHVQFLGGSGFVSFQDFAIKVTFSRLTTFP
jgi:hypothetical protein